MADAGTAVAPARRPPGCQVYALPVSGGTLTKVASSEVQLKADPADVAAGFKPMVWVGGDKLAPYYNGAAGAWQSHGCDAKGDHCTMTDK